MDKITHFKFKTCCTLKIKMQNSHPFPVHVSLCVPPAICNNSLRKLPHFEYK